MVDDISREHTLHASFVTCQSLGMTSKLETNSSDRILVCIREPVCQASRAEYVLSASALLSKFAIATQSKTHWGKGYQRASTSNPSYNWWSLSKTLARSISTIPVGAL